MVGVGSRENVERTPENVQGKPHPKSFQLVIVLLSSQCGSYFILKTLHMVGWENICGMKLSPTP